MIRVSKAEFQKEAGRYETAALSDVVIVTTDGRERTVMISAEEYWRLKRRDREVFAIEDCPDDIHEAVKRSEAPPEAARFNHEMDS